MINTLVAGMLSLTGSALLLGETPRAVIDVSVPDSSSFVELWTSEDMLSRGERVNVWFRTARDAFVTVLRVDTDGRVRILFPLRPWHNNYVAAGLPLQVRDPACDDERCTFVVDDYPGQGFVFAIASSRQFDYDDLVRGEYWNYRGIAFNGRVTGDPFVAVSELMDRIVPGSGRRGFSYDVTSYYVENHYQYPRFLCYDCHAYARFPAWDPYAQSCTQFQLVIHNGPAYVPARTYVDSRVVFTEPHAIAPRYVFTNRRPNEPFVTTVPRPNPNRPSTSRRIVGASANDVGGVGRVPAPLGRRLSDSNPDRGRRIFTPGRDPNSGRRVVVRGDTVPARPQPRLQRRVPTRRTDSLQASRGGPVRQTLPGSRARVTRPVVPRTMIPSRGTTAVPSRTQSSVKPATTQGRRRTKPDSLPVGDPRLSNRPGESPPGGR